MPSNCLSANYFLLHKARGNKDLCLNNRRMSELSRLQETIPQQGRMGIDTWMDRGWKVGRKERQTESPHLYFKFIKKIILLPYV